MFKSEDEMQVLFHDLLVEKEKNKAQGRYHFFREVDATYNKPDVVAYARPTDIVTYELKLKNCKKVWEQAYKNLIFGHAFIVIPSSEIEKTLKYFDKNYKENILMKKIGIISLEKNGFKIIKRTTGKLEKELKQGEQYNPYMPSTNQLVIVDKIMRGFYLGGANEQNKKGRLGY